MLSFSLPYLDFVKLGPKELGFDSCGMWTWVGNALFVLYPDSLQYNSNNHKDPQYERVCSWCLPSYENIHRNITRQAYEIILISGFDCIRFPGFNLTLMQYSP
ncbi:hypothetical protein Dimus_011626 [Dionaea muscipula]